MYLTVVVEAWWEGRPSIREGGEIVPIESGYLTSLEVEYVRTAHYSVLYQLDGLPVRRVTITAHPRIGLVGKVRESEPGDSVSVTTSEDGGRLIDWNNHTLEALWADFQGTWGEVDD